MLKKTLNLYQKTIISLFLGILWGTTYTGLTSGFLSWILLVPLILLIKNETYYNTYLISIAFGMPSYFIATLWVPQYLNNNLFLELLPTNLSLIWICISWIINFAICIYHAFQYSLIFLLCKFFSEKWKTMYYPFLLTTFTVIDSTYPKLWLDKIGYSQQQFLYLIQTSDIFGVYFISFLIILCNISIIVLIKSIMTKKYLIYSIIVMSFTLILIILSNVYGYQRLKKVNKIISASSKVKIGVLQTNIYGKEYNVDNLKEITKKINEQINAVLIYKPEIIILPESTFPGAYTDWTIDYSDIILDNYPPVILGMSILDHTTMNTKKPVFYNSLILVSNKEKKDSYYKINLYPFGEKNLLFLMNLNNQPFYAGKECTIMHIDNIKISPNICFEILIPEFICKSCKVNSVESNLIINSTNDSWALRDFEADITLNIARFRAIENRKSIVRATSTGFSAVINPAGNLIDNYKSKLYKEDSFVKEAPLLEIPTVYNLYGWLFIWILRILSIIYACFYLLKFFIFI